jgi:hypothetical protein
MNSSFSILAISSLRDTCNIVSNITLITGIGEISATKEAFHDAINHPFSLEEKLS